MGGEGPTRTAGWIDGWRAARDKPMKSMASLDEELSAWRNRPLGEIPYLILDARYEKIRHGGAVVSCAVLVAIGVNDGFRDAWKE